MRRGVDEIRESSQSGREADRGAVERDDENLRMAVEGLGDVEIVGDEVLQRLAVLVFALRGGAIDVDVGTAGEGYGVRFIGPISVIRSIACTYAEKKRPLPVRTVMKMSLSSAMSRMCFERV